VMLVEDVVSDEEGARPARCCRLSSICSLSLSIFVLRAALSTSDAPPGEEGVAGADVADDDAALSMGSPGDRMGSANGAGDAGVLLLEEEVMPSMGAAAAVALALLAIAAVAAAAANLGEGSTVITN